MTEILSSHIVTRLKLTPLIITILFGRLGECQLHGATVGVVPLTHATFVLVFVGANLLVAAYML